MQRGKSTCKTLFSLIWDHPWHMTRDMDNMFDLIDLIIPFFN